jgi:cytidylate kinase
MRIIKAPYEVPADASLKLFLAGSIEEGAAEQWQEKIIRELIVIL